MFSGVDSIFPFLFIRDNILNIYIYGIDMRMSNELPFYLCLLKHNLINRDRVARRSVRSDSRKLVVGYRWGCHRIFRFFGCLIHSVGTRFISYRHHVLIRRFISCFLDEATSSSPIHYIYNSSSSVTRNRIQLETVPALRIII